jgi:hypothetical protein
VSAVSRGILVSRAGSAWEQLVWRAQKLGRALAGKQGTRRDVLSDLDQGKAPGLPFSFSPHPHRRPNTGTSAGAGSRRPAGDPSARRATSRMGAARRTGPAGWVRWALWGCGRVAGERQEPRAALLRRKSAIQAKPKGQGRILTASVTVGWRGCVGGDT